MSLLGIGILIVTHVVAFGGGIVLHATLISKVEALVTDVQTAVNDVLAKLPKI